MADIVVFHDKVHGLDPAAYAAELREAFPDASVALARTPAEKREQLADAVVATGFQIDPALLDDAPNLELFACTFAGTGHLPTDALGEAGVAVSNASGVHGPNIAEQVLGYVLADVRNLRRAFEQDDAGEWRHFQCGELRRSTATVVGMGPIGREIVARFDDFGVETIGVRYTPSKGGNADEVVGYDETLAAAARSDYLVLACPLTEETEGLVDEAVFAAMPTDAMLVNIARGPVVETDALVAALRTNDIASAAVDVTDPEPLPAGHPLWDLGNCLVTPHNAGHTPKYWERCASLVEDAVEDADVTW